jgi:acylglycerol lipase
VIAARAAPALLLLLLLAGCFAAPLPPPLGDIMPPRLAEDRFIAADGTALPLRHWLPAGKPLAVVLALHGMNDYSNAFDAPAKVWAADGIATYAYDQRGFGEAPLRGRWPGTWQFADDLAAASRALRAHYPGVPLYLLGESMGAAIIVAGVTGADGAPPPVADGIILTAPAVWGRSTMNIFERGALWFAGSFLPSLTLTGQGLHIQASDNLPMLRALGRDPLVIKETRVDTIVGLVDLMDTAYDAAPSMPPGLPSFIAYGKRDQIIPGTAVRQWIAALPPAPPGKRVVAVYDKGWHMLLRDLEAAIVVKDIESWIFAPAAPLPSGAGSDAPR